MYFINRMIYYISQGRVEPHIRIGGQLCYSSVANLLQYLYAKNYQNMMELDKVIAKNKRVQFFALQCIYNESDTMYSTQYPLHRCLLVTTLVI